MPAPGDVISVLVVSSVEDDIIFLRHALSHSNWRLMLVRSSNEAATCIRSGEIPVVLCSSELADGNWKDVVAEAVQRPDPPRVIVIGSLADDSLWSEVLEMGGYDVVGRPFDSRELVRVISLAWRQWHDHREQVARRPANLN